jgi:tellurite resistance protein TehA-like permease
VGTFVTGTTQLALHTELPAFRVAAVIAYVGLLSTWGLVALRTARGGISGNLFAPPPVNAGPVKAKKDPPPVPTT